MTEEGTLANKPPWFWKTRSPTIIEFARIANDFEVHLRLISSKQICIVSVDFGEFAGLKKNVSLACDKVFCSEYKFRL